MTDSSTLKLRARSLPKQMDHLVFRNGRWNTISLPFSDPILPPHELQRAAAQIASAPLYKREAATIQAEAAMYQRLYPGLGGIPRKQHHTPEHQKKQPSMQKKAKGGWAS